MLLNSKYEFKLYFESSGLQARILASNSHGLKRPFVQRADNEQDARSNQIFDRKLSRKQFIEDRKKTGEDQDKKHIIIEAVKHLDVQMFYCRIGSREATSGIQAQNNESVMQTLFNNYMCSLPGINRPNKLDRMTNEKSPQDGDGDGYTSTGGHCE
jgi:hypothetical protein